MTDRAPRWRPQKRSPRSPRETEAGGRPRAAPPAGCERGGRWKEERARREDLPGNLSETEPRGSDPPDFAQGPLGRPLPTSTVFPKKRYGGSDQTDSRVRGCPFTSPEAPGPLPASSSIENLVRHAFPAPFLHRLEFWAHFSHHHPALSLHLFFQKRKLPVSSPLSG